MLGRYDKSAEEFGKAKELDPSQAIPYSGLVIDYMALNQLSKAHAVYQEAQARKVSAGEAGRQSYFLAFLEGDKETMARVADSLAGEPGNEIKALLAESSTEAYFGHLGRSEKLFRQAKDVALAQGDQGAAADIEARATLPEALFGNSAAARHQAADALSFGEQPTAFVALAAGDSTPSTLALALAGDAVLATNVAERLASQTPPGGFANKVWLPEVRAAIELDRGNPMRALELLAGGKISRLTYWQEFVPTTNRLRWRRRVKNCVLECTSFCAKAPPHEILNNSCHSSTRTIRRTVPSSPMTNLRATS